jgi:hypothetical protein
VLSRVLRDAAATAYVRLEGWNWEHDAQMGCLGREEVDPLFLVSNVLLVNMGMGHSRRAEAAALLPLLLAVILFFKLPYSLFFNSSLDLSKPLVSSGAHPK